MKVTLEFSGGAELLVGKIKKHNVELPDKNEWTLEGLLAWVGNYGWSLRGLAMHSLDIHSPTKVRDNMLQDRPELFMKDNTVNLPSYLHQYHLALKLELYIIQRSCCRYALEFWS